MHLPANREDARSKCLDGESVRWSAIAMDDITLINEDHLRIAVLLGDILDAE